MKPINQVHWFDSFKLRQMPIQSQSVHAAR
jgi:hypothetical protein